MGQADMGKLWSQNHTYHNTHIKMDQTLVVLCCYKGTQLPVYVTQQLITFLYIPLRDVRRWD
jgi:hypothetical protein